MKNINLLLLTLFFLVSCSGFKEAGKVLRNEKVNSTDEFLVKKREPLILPPDYDKMPEPNSNSNTSKSKETNRIKNILKKTDQESKSKQSSSSTEKSILNRIKK
tara:strand:+ start:1594 stop:1905 length:312 start_codon:yes stop_codon:yes gene_type:complete